MRNAAGAVGLALAASACSLAGIAEPRPDAGCDALTCESLGTDVLSYGVSCDGTTDDTPALERALADFPAWRDRALVFPTGRTCRVSSVSWSRPVGTEDGPYVIAGHGSVLAVLDGTSTSTDTDLLRIFGARWIVIDDLDLDGNRDSRPVPTQEFSIHNLKLSDVQNARFRGIDSRRATMDGFFVGAGNRMDTETYSKRVVFEGCSASDSFRIGMTIANCWDCQVLGGVFENSHGTAPEAGLYLRASEGSAPPSSSDILVDGATFRDHPGRCVGLSGVGDPDRIAFRNNVLEDCRSMESTCGAAFLLGAAGTTIESNTIQGFVGSAACRAFIDLPASSVSHQNVVRNNVFRNIASNGTRLLFIHSINSGANEFSGNRVEDSDYGSTSDWCSDNNDDFTDLIGPDIIRDNTFDGLVQAPNPGCP